MLIGGKTLRNSKLKINKKIISILPIITLILLSITIQTSKATPQNYSFIDHFNENQIDKTKWQVQENTNMSGQPAFGASVNIANSQIYLSSTGDGTSFPYVHSLNNPFPPSNDFIVEFDLTYDCISDWGSGVWISKGPLTIKDSSRIEDVNSANMIFQVWADNEGSWTQTGIRIKLFEKQVYRTVVNGWEPSADTIIFKLEYKKGVYTVFIDSKEIASERSQIRPDNIGFGHPPAYYVPFTHQHAIGNVGKWSSFTIDYIKVFYPTIISLSTKTTTTQLGSTIDLHGTLHNLDGTPIVGEIVILSYLIPGTQNWNPVTSTTTNNNGSFIAAWLPTATGNFLVKAEWIGNQDSADNYNIKNITVVNEREDSDSILPPSTTTNYSSTDTVLSSFLNEISLISISKSIEFPILITTSTIIVLAGLGILVYFKKRSNR